MNSPYYDYYYFFKKYLIEEEYRYALIFFSGMP